ncbi:DNA-binding transcriptional regulator, MarR family [Andreprevotia lacus DSM 23236]|jgi:DNA-binding MarR family transcriptional regulator|uniref:DNA-binding transcriptional regulator, MarR family n=1 Tax=Andreprevotia lacus DSM 23236 TaxID=1121001 RepID=A0A1W1XMV3_9NEIS|nr:MarR family transcriptional regulator [Andreprevotia lacus]SMC25309.1 DNA-binding transcriptional regulator, MarR family [Andreprevotia lacus DSM 23236]
MIDQKTASLDRALELLFYGYRAFTAKADALLAERGLGRVHHRILYFVGHQPDSTVGELLQRLRVSKQALNAPLRDLQQAGLIDALVCENDKRARRLRLTDAGMALERALSDGQRDLLRGIFDAAGPAAADGWWQVMERLAAADLADRLTTD